MQRTAAFLWLFWLSPLACNAPQPAATSSANPVMPSGILDAATAPAPAASATVTDVDAGPRAVLPLEGAEAETTLFSDAPSAHAAEERATACGSVAAPKGSAQERVDCLIGLRFAKDPAASKIAAELYDRYGILAGVDVDHIMDGGYRGMLHLVPATPIGPARRHIEWILSSANDFDAFFKGLEQKRLEQSGARTVGYRWRPIALHFMRSVAARTPSAYAEDWTVAYNLDGSLHVSADAVRETMFHEIFHLNDDGWSEGALGLVFDSIVRKCGTKTACLAPFSPGTTMVRNGTFYSFQPGNGVREYAAELALRYYRENRAILRKEPRIAAFKCGPPSNAQTWDLLVQKFFGGIDLTPACGSR